VQLPRELVRFSSGAEILAFLESRFTIVRIFPRSASFTAGRQGLTIFCPPPSGTGGRSGGRRTALDQGRPPRRLFEHHRTESWPESGGGGCFLVETKCCRAIVACLPLAPFPRSNGEQAVLVTMLEGPPHSPLVESETPRPGALSFGSAGCRAGRAKEERGWQACNQSEQRPKAAGLHSGFLWGFL